MSDPSLGDLLDGLCHARSRWLATDTGLGAVLRLHALAERLLARTGPVRAGPRLYRPCPPGQCLECLVGDPLPGESLPDARRLRLPADEAAAYLQAMALLSGDDPP